MDGICIGQDGAIALGNAITNNKMIKKLLLAGEHNHYVAIDKESAMIIIKSLYNNNTITELSLLIELCQSDAISVTEEAEKVNSIKKLSNDHVIDFELYFIDPEGESYGVYSYVTGQKLSWRTYSLLVLMRCYLSINDSWKYFL